MLSAAIGALRSLGQAGPAAPLPPGPRLPAWAVAVAAAASLLYFCLATHLPVTVLGNTSFDDAWFFERARNMVAGRWMGHFSQVTLIKGPGYVFFLAANAILGTPVTLTQALLYMFGCGLFCLALFRLSRSAVLALAVFLAALLQPDVFPGRLIRDDIYAAQTLIFLGCLIHALYLSEARRGRALWAVCAGLSLAWLWLTREEGVWVAPATLVLCLAGVWRDRARWRDVAGLVGTGVAAATAVAACNFAAYGAFTVADLKSPAFARALDAVQSVRVGPSTAYLPVPRRVRERLYAESPAFASLRPYFEGVGQNWTQAGCQIYPSTCGDYAAGWFVWALRDAVAQAGHYRSPAEADRFYRTLTAEVRTACAAGRLQCAHGLISLMPGVTADQWRQAPAKTQGAASLLLYRQPPPPVPASVGDPEAIEAMWVFEGLPPRTRADGERSRLVAGWFHAPTGAWIQLRCGAAVIPVEHKPAPDIVTHFNDPSAANSRFRTSLSTDEDCRVQLQGAGPQDPGPNFATLMAKRDAALGGGQLYIDTFGAGAADAAATLAQRIQTGLARVYGLLAPAICAAAALAYLAHLALLWRRSLILDPYWWLCHAIWLLVLCRVAILVLVDLSSFPAINPSYLAPAFPLFWGALLLTVALPLRAIRLKP